MGCLKFNGAFFSEILHGELRANGNRQRVLVKRFANKTVCDIPMHRNCPELLVSHRSEATRRRSGGGYGNFVF